ncbi:hypothetical protein VTN96DRAFT_7983 [Rasamsonia emersonii]
MLVPSYRDLLVAAARQADPAVVSVELPEQWYKVKVHGVPTRRYLANGLGLAREEIELGTEYRLKRDPIWLRNPEEIREQKGSTIVITVGSLEEARKILINGIRFGGSRYRTEHYWDLGADTVCPRCCGIGHYSFRACGDRPPLCFICAGPHEGADHVCKVVNCTTKPGTAGQHMPAKCGNCGGPHPATTGTCPKIREARKRLSKKREPSVGPLGGQELIQAMIPSSPGFAVVVSSQEATQIPERETPQPQPEDTQPPQTPKTPVLQGDEDMGNAQTPRAGTGPSSTAEC